MGKQPQQPTEQTIKQQSIPDQFMPYYERVFQQAQNVTAQPYQPYSGPRLADFSGTTNQGMDLSKSSAGNWQPSTNAATSAINQGVQATQNATGWNPTTINAPTVNDYQMGDLGSWNSSTASQYMNPFINNVLGTQVADAQHQFQVDQIGRDDAAIRQRAFGGSGAQIGNAEAAADHERNMNSMIASGLFNAYQTGQQQYSTERGQNLQAGQTNLDALLKSQDLRANMDYNTQLQNNQFGLDKANLNLNAGAQFGTLANASNATAQNISSMSGADIQRLLTSGSMTDTHNQQALDLAYQDFVNQRDYGKNNVSWLGGIIAGQPVGSNTTTTGYQITNPYAQLLGAGIGAAGLAKNLG